MIRPTSRLGSRTVVLLGLACSAYAHLLPVGPGGGCFASIATAVSQAKAGDTVLVANGLYHETIRFVESNSGTPAREAGREIGIQQITMERPVDKRRR